MALRVDPVFMYPESSVMCLLVDRSLRISTARSPSVPTMVGSSYSTPSRINLAVSPMGGHDSRPGFVQRHAPCKFTRAHTSSSLNLLVMASVGATVTHGSAARRRTFVLLSAHAVLGAG